MLLNNVAGECAGECVGESSSSSFILKASLFPRFLFHASFSQFPFSTYNPKNSPLRMQTKQLHVIPHTLFPRLPTPAPTPRPLHHQPFCKQTPNHLHSLRSRCPNHLNLPRLTTSATQLIPRRLHKSSLCLLSFKDTPHIHLTIIRSVLSKLFRSSAFIAQVSVPYIKTLCTQAL